MSSTTVSFSLTASCNAQDSSLTSQALTAQLDSLFLDSTEVKVLVPFVNDSLIKEVAENKQRLEIIPLSPKAIVALPNNPMFANHRLEVKHERKEVIRPMLPSWISWVVLLSFTIYVWVKVFNARKLNQLTDLLLANAGVNRVVRDAYLLSSRVSVFLILSFLLVTGLFIYQLLGYYKIQLPWSGWLLYSLVVAVLTVLVLLKQIAVAYLGHVFDIGTISYEYVFNTLVYHKMLGLLLLPIVGLLAFSPQLQADVLIRLGIGIAAALLVYRTLRSVAANWSGSGVSFVYLFLYLCCIEIAPLIVLIKLTKLYLV